MKHKFKEGEIVIHRLTAEWLMILAQVDQEPPGYQVRRQSDYGVMAVAEFELMTQDEKDQYELMAKNGPEETDEESESA